MPDPNQPPVPRPDAAVPPVVPSHGRAVGMPVPRRGPAAERPRRHPLDGPQHLPLRPLWLCRACGLTWPCAEARLLLRVEYDNRRLDLAVYLSGLYYEATHDLFRLDPEGGPTPRELFQRFVAWGPYRRPALALPPACTGRCRTA